jgi:hypothetical protein
MNNTNNFDIYRGKASYRLGIGQEINFAKFVPLDLTYNI